MTSTTEPTVAAALANDLVIDITTTGRNSGEPQRIEIWFHNVDDRYYITGRPGPRSWYANVLANPTVTFHLKESTQADLNGSARAVTDHDEKRSFFLAARKLGEYINQDNVQEWVDGSPLIEVVFDG